VRSDPRQPFKPKTRWEIKAYVVDVHSGLCTKHLDICLVTIDCDSTYMSHTVDAICEFDDTNSVVGILMIRKLGVLDWLTESVNFVDLFFTVWTAGRDTSEPTCGIYLVYADIGKQSSGSGREANEKALKSQVPLETADIATHQIRRRRRLIQI
jgi:hypothetical protein